MREIQNFLDVERIARAMFQANVDIALDLNVSETTFQAMETELLNLRRFLPGEDEVMRLEDSFGYVTEAMGPVTIRKAPPSGGA